jgi:hypothetical protein
MPRLAWGEGPPEYDLGVDHGVLYLGGVGVPWNGLVSVEERDTALVSADYYFDGQLLAISQLTGDFEASISAYTYPDAFAEYNGFSERSTYQRFGLSYRTQHADKQRLHLVYGALVNEKGRSWQTVSDSADATLFRWDITTTAVPMPGASPASHLILDVPRNSDAFTDVEDILWGTDTTDPRLPTPAELIEIYDAATILTIVYNGDGSYTASGPDDMVRLLDNGRFEISAPSVFFKDADIFVVNSY